MEELSYMILSTIFLVLTCVLLIVVLILSILLSKEITERYKIEDNLKKKFNKILNKLNKDNYPRYFFDQDKREDKENE